jgi:hypothetical protein
VIREYFFRRIDNRKCHFHLLFIEVLVKNLFVFPVRLTYSPLDGVPCKCLPYRTFRNTDEQLGRIISRKVCDQPGYAKWINVKGFPLSKEISDQDFFAQPFIFSESMPHIIFSSTHFEGTVQSPWSWREQFWRGLRCSGSALLQRLPLRLMARMPLLQCHFERNPGSS